MAISIIEWIVLAFVVLGLIKTIVVLRDPKKWMGIVEKMFSKPKVLMVVSYVLAALMLWYLLGWMSIVEIFGAMVFLSLLIMAMYAQFPDVIVSMTKKVLKEKGLVGRLWFPIVVWLGLMLWAALAILR
ncbi:hypothetical protein HOC01_04330 [archaeon]|jgi:hypothetical protein|nr:hypothetical protein [archaeon]MBT6698361.1 hypothetical protein [archaeon]